MIGRFWRAKLFVSVSVVALASWVAPTPADASQENAKGFQAANNPAATLCDTASPATKAALGCFQGAFYPGGPAPFPWTAGSLREAWLNACLLSVNPTSGLPVPDQHTKIACCNPATGTCSKLGPPLPATASSNPADCPTGTQAFACPYPAVTNTLMKNGKFLHWTGIDGIEDQLEGIGFLAQAQEVNSPWRVLDLSNGAPGSLTTPVFKDLVTGSLVFDDTGGGGDRFCAGVTVLPSGKVMTAGGTRWDATTGIELFGLNSTSIYDPDTNQAVRAGDMADGRWYMSMVETGTGQVLGGAGISELRLPITHNSTWETFDPATSSWTLFAGSDAAFDPAEIDTLAAIGGVSSARLLLPLFSRPQLLPSGQVFYPGVGQLWGPFGEHYIEAAWNFTFAASVAEGTWRSVTDTEGLPDATVVRNGAEVLQAPLRPPYNSTTIVTMGGNEYRDSVPTPLVEIASITFPGGQPVVNRTVSPNLMQKARWFATAVLLPDQSVIDIGGGTCDEVVAPGCELPIFETERSTSGGTGPWMLTATAQRPRTYHNTAGLVTPEGTVVSAGHRPIPVSYADSPDALALLFQAHNSVLQQIGRDMMWETYQPGYLFDAAGNPSSRPAIKSAPDQIGYGTSFCINAQSPITGTLGQLQAQLLRPIAVTHVDQHEQRLIELATEPGTGTNGCGLGWLKVTAPPDGNVAPPGYYLLNVLALGTNNNPLWPDVPSKSQFVQVCRASFGFGDKCKGP